jgi:hypothetical protein
VVWEPTWLPVGERDTRREIFSAQQKIFGKSVAFSSFTRKGFRPSRDTSSAGPFSQTLRRKHNERD